MSNAPRQSAHQQNLGVDLVHLLLLDRVLDLDLGLLLGLLLVLVRVRGLLSDGDRENLHVCIIYHQSLARLRLEKVSNQIS